MLTFIRFPQGTPFHWNEIYARSQNQPDEGGTLVLGEQGLGGHLPQSPVCAPVESGDLREVEAALRRWPWRLSLAPMIQHFTLLLCSPLCCACV